LPVRPQQLHLPIELRREPTLAEYLPGRNGEALAALESAAAGRGEPFLFLYGLSGTGKTHLLQGACLAAARHGRKSHYCPLGLPGLAPGVLEDLERLDLVAVDDLDRIAGQGDWERALFDLFNRLRERGRALVTAAATAPDALGLGLPDLCSRLQWGPRYRLLPLDEPACETLLLVVARGRGLVLAPEVVRYIMTRYPRDPASLLDLVGRVDALSLREQRQPTIPLVRRAMQGDAVS
jgi:DnaA family protein